ncbi:MAG: tetratricopeptide repeat protein [Bacteroidaceae bacterium]|nr:tetratricopeptide repeat protein [Bacteroidaceae bacterium]
MTDQEQAEALYQQGNQYRKQSDWQHALECYHRAIELDPSSPAVKAKEMVDNILAYYCKAMFNP